MSNLFLIGNGFDLACGLKSKYTDIYGQYIHEKSTNEVINEFRKAIKSDIATWGDFEMEMAEYARNFSNEGDYVDCVRDFRNHMCKYLLQQQAYFFDMIKDNSFIKNNLSLEISESIENYNGMNTNNCSDAIKANNNNFGNDTHYISFNYTNVFDHLIRMYKRGADVLHIHGSLQNEDIALGVDNPSQIKNTNFLLGKRGKRAFVKTLFNDEFDHKRVEKAKALIENASNIWVYGMSLGESDLTWRNALLEWIKKNESNQLVIYDYSLSNKGVYSADERMEYEEERKNELKEKWGKEINEEVFDRIHIPCGKNIFRIAEAIDKGKQSRANYENMIPHFENEQPVK